MPAEQQPNDQRLDPAPRRFAAMCAATLEPVAPAEGQAQASGGRWRLYSGAELYLRVWGLNMRMGAYGPYPEPIRCVIDLATAQFQRPKIRALVDHWESMRAVAGWWTDGQVSAAGIDAALTWFEPKDETARDLIAHIALARELVGAGDPMEASVGISPETNVEGPEGWDLIAQGASVEVNGQTFVADDRDTPLYVLRNGRVFEASLVLFGADSNTGRMTASRQPTLPKESPAMSLNAARIKALCDKHPDHKAIVMEALASADDITDEQIGQKVLEAENAALKAQLDEATKPKPPAAPAPAAPTAQAAALRAAAEGAAAKPPGSGTGTDDDAPADFPAAYARLAADGSKAKGFALRAEALRRWPSLRDLVPKA